MSPPTKKLIIVSDMSKKKKETESLALASEFDWWLFQKEICFLLF